MHGGTLFSGVGAPELAAPWIDWRWCAEIDPFASAVHAARFPGVPNLGDVTEVDWDGRERVDVVAFGSPCQSFSVAGKRLGLDDPRGNLAIVALGIVARLRPRWILFENVPGLLSSDGFRDFGAFLAILGECGYGFAHRVLDARHFGIPQRRRRVFVVGHLGDWRPPAAVLLEPARLRRDTAPSGEAREDLARPLASCPGGGSGYRNDADTAENLIPISFRANASFAEHGYDESGTLNAENRHAIICSDTLRSHPRPGSNSLGGIVPPLTGNPRGDHDAREGLLVFDWQSGGDVRHNVSADAVSALQSSQVPAICEPVDTTGHQGDVVVSEAGTWPTLPSQSANNGGGGGAILHARSSIRRLTPREWERLMGMPDDHTLVEVRGKPAADGPRYRAIGNSMAVPVVRWIFDRIRLFEGVAGGR